MTALSWLLAGRAAEAIAGEGQTCWRSIACHAEREDAGLPQTSLVRPRELGSAFASLRRSLTPSQSLLARPGPRTTQPLASHSMSAATTNIKEQLPSHRPIPLYRTLEEIYPDSHVEQASVLPPAEGKQQAG